MRANAATNPCCACSGLSAYRVMVTNEPICGSDALYRSAANSAEVSRSQNVSLRLVLNTAIPVLKHLVGGGNPQRANKAEAKPLRIGVIPDALRKLRILLLP